MKFSEAWLREWVDPDIERDALLKQLTMAGLEVAAVEAVAAKFTGVIVGVVSECAKHPDADKLSVCQVSDGDNTYQVVCGAPNVRAGLVTAFARIGAVLPDNFKIKKAKLRGIESQGMLCSAAELGLGDDHDGIIELPSEWQAGSDLVDVMQLDDITIDLDLTPNRGDCLSLKGIAREVGVLNNTAVAYPKIEPVAATIDDVFPVSLADAQGCPRYLGRVIRNIDPSASTPLWMRERLRRCGLRSIDPVVDVTNFVLIELGQPMHAFDLKNIKQGIVVRMAQAGEKLSLLDGQELALDDQTLLITDANGPVAIAGVMGGHGSGVQVDTKDVFLECAYFNPLTIAGTARRYGLHTDASHRYERGVDFTLQSEAIERATQLLLDIVGGEAGPVHESLDQVHLPQAVSVRLRQSRLTELLGVDIAAKQVDEAFARLDFQMTSRDEVDGSVEWTVLAPSHRFDIAIEADLVEEVCRIYGYNNVPSKQPLTTLALRHVELEKNTESALKRQLAAIGFQEVITYSFIDPVLQDMLDPGFAPVTLTNPMSSEQSVMRTNLLGGLVDAALSNRSRQQDRTQLFEIGLVFRQEESGLQQTSRLAGLLWGSREVESWAGQSKKMDFFDAKGAVDALIDWAGLLDVTFSKVSDPVLHPGQSAAIHVQGVSVGRVGRLHPEIESKLDIEGVYVFEIDSEIALTNTRRTHTGISKFPSVRRDLALVVDKAVPAAVVEGVVREALGGILVDFRLFDVYEGKGVDSNEKSLGLGLTLQSQTATLTEEDIGHFEQIAVQALQEKVGGHLR
ncbi:MAG: phenylalanine--tRNA ligase subunit beta [Gammaproteobacteria bacterium]|nr:phenylalanine--tRNA ligase subunit beta [Gammaproteobacteria bacterium]